MSWCALQVKSLRPVPRPPQRVGHRAATTGVLPLLTAPLLATAALLTALTTLLPALLTAAALVAAARAARWGGLLLQPQRQRDPLACGVYLQHLRAHDVAGLDALARVLHEVARQLRDVGEPVAVHADVDERAERGHVGDHSFEDHAHFQ